MRLVIQRVKNASVTVDGAVVGAIEKGFLILIGICSEDTKEIADKMLHKALGLRIFEDAEGKTNLDLNTVEGKVLLISQFTLYASCVKGRRPGFTDAAKPDEAERIYNYFVEKVKSMGLKKVSCGEFGADMEVEIINDGPLTFIIDSPKGD